LEKADPKKEVTRNGEKPSMFDYECGSTDFVGMKFRNHAKISHDQEGSSIRGSSQGKKTVNRKTANRAKSRKRRPTI